MTKYLVLALIIIAIVFIAYWMGMRSEKGKSETQYATKDTTIRDVLALDEDIEEMLAKRGMHCAACPSAVSETLEQACTVHNLDVDETLVAINDYMKQREQINDD